MISCILVALGGAMGAAFALSDWAFALREPFLFPVKAFTLNIMGCLVIGVIAILCAQMVVSE